MKKIQNITALLLALMLVTNSCKEEFLEINPNGSLDGNVLATSEGVNALLIGAYSMLDGISSQGFGWEAAGSNWVYGSIRGMEANKGTDAGDQPDINPIQSYSENSANPYLNVKFRSVYEAISRTNAVLRTIEMAKTAGKISDDDAASYAKQARVLRGWYHFEAWRMWTMIPYIDEKAVATEVTNTEDVTDKIIDDLTEGTTLPEDMDQIGRWNGTVSRVVLAKALMQMKGNYAAAKTLLETVKTSGKKPNGDAIGLDPNYGDIFDAAKRNTSPENIYVVQYSVNDGSGGQNGGNGEVLNFPYKGGGGSPGGCCGFFQPNQDFVNSFRTNGGLPYLDGTYNDHPVVNDAGLGVDAAFTEDGGPLDPRLDWSVGRRGIPYLDWGPHTGQDWVRDQSYGGVYSPKKQVYKKSQEGVLTEVGNWTSGWTANGYRFIRYADVLLLLAECQIKTNDIPSAKININLVRKRASNANGFVKEADGTTNAANYQISEYGAGYPFDNEANAMAALMMERKLELGQEGHRYFDLQRWGTVVSELSRVLAYEKSQRPGQYGSATVGPEDVNFPIPQQQIDLSIGRFQQNR